MYDMKKFRAGRFGAPAANPVALPAFCRECPCLVQEQSQVCFYDGLFYYYCAYSESGNPDSIPPCMSGHNNS